MARRKIKRRRGEGITISTPATVHVSRRVTLVIDAPHEAQVARLKRQRPAPPPATSDDQPAKHKRTKKSGR
jgi:hypothetical protein